MPGCNGTGAAERSYPATEVRGSGREKLPPARQGRWPREPGCNSAGAAKRSFPTSEVRGGGREEKPHVQGVVAARAQEGLEELLHVQGQRGGSEEIPLVQGKEQRLRFAGAAVKKYPMSMVRETQVKL